jgi:hypothetical protein
MRMRMPMATMHATMKMSMGMRTITVTKKKIIPSDNPKKRGRPKGSKNRKRVATTAQTSGGKKASPPRCRSEEDLMLSKAWTNATLNPIKGTDQNAEAF